MRKQLIACVVAGGLAMTAPPLGAFGAQNEAVKALLAASDRAARQLQFDEAEARVAEAMVLAERSGDAADIARSQRTRCANLSRESRLLEALTWCERALASFESLHDTPGTASALHGLAVAALALGKSGEARAYAERGLQVLAAGADDVVRGYLLMNLYSALPADRRSDDLLVEAADLGARLGDGALHGNALVRLGSAHFARGELDDARRKYEEGIDVLRLGSDVEGLAAAYLSLGRVFRAHGDYSGALQRYRQAIDLLAPTRERSTLVEALNASATALGALGRREEALATTERGLSLARESGNQRLIDFMEGNLAGMLMGVKAYDRAIPLLEGVIGRKPEPYIAAFRYTQLATALTHVGRAAEARPLADESVRLTRDLKQIDYLDQRLDTRAWILTKLGRFDEALADSREALAVIENLREQVVPSDFLKRGFGARSEAAYLRGIDLLARLGRSGEALAFAEQGRTRAFLDLLAARESGDTTLATRGAVTPGVTGGRDLASAARGRPLDLAGMDRIATRLDSTILVYCVLDEATLIWVVRPGATPSHTRVPIARDRLSSLVTATMGPLRDSPGATATRGPDDLTALPMRGLGLATLKRDDRSAWRELYGVLIDPIRTHLPPRNGRLTIVPHGPLFGLAFAALRSPSSGYLVEDYELHYSPAVSALDFTGRRQQAVASNANGPWVIVGNPALLPSVGGRALPPLPGAAREIVSIAALAPKGRARRLEGVHADEASLERTIVTSRPAVLHFATHGFVFDDGKTPPFLALHRRDASEQRDGRLTLDEVYGLTLETDLVVLSACRSGSGKVSNDGVIGLTRGFFYAGSPSVLATFWDVTDEATALLMSRFYRSYARNAGKGASLRAAQLALLRDLRLGRVVIEPSGRRVVLPEHPLLWAAFFLSGEP